MKKLKLVSLAFIVILCSFFLNSCGQIESKNSSGGNISTNKKNSDAAVVVDTAKAIHKLVTAAKGGELSLQNGKGEKMKVVFLQQSLTKNANLVMAPISKTYIDDKDLISRGFSLEEKGTGKGPITKFPALIIFSVTKALPVNTSIIKYHDKGDGYDIIPSKVISKGGKSIVAATVSSFSKYGIKLTKTKDKIKKRKESKDFNWVIYVKDKVSFTTGPMKQSLSINMKAVNTSGDICGDYKGTISSVATNDMEVSGGKATVPGKSFDNNLRFSIDIPIPVVPLVKSKKINVVPLVSPDMIGRGNINMTSNGTATVYAAGYTSSEDISNNSSIPFVIKIIGPQVQLEINLCQRTLYFDGYIRGEGKK